CANEDAALISLQVVAFADTQQMNPQELNERDVFVMAYMAVVSGVAFDVVTRRDHLMGESRRDRVRVGKALHHNDVALSPMPSEQGFKLFGFALLARRCVGGDAGRNFAHFASFISLHLLQSLP